MDHPHRTEPDASRSPSADGPATTLHDIRLTPAEERLFALLRGANAWGDLRQTIRVAGGWVRDRLLGVVSDDVDVVLDGMTGRSFVGALRRYVDVHRSAGAGVMGEALPERGLGRGYLVTQNIDRSKHLETAGVEIFGLKVEFVHLRSERYAAGSRVPRVEFGDALTDARRRDLTINALFWRLDTGQVEDLVGGLDDLRAMRLVTPLEPTRTFLDDPLRVLRVARFRSRFGGSSMDEATRSAIRRSDVVAAYRDKVAAERSGAEVMKLFGGEAPDAALTDLGGAEWPAVVFGLEELVRADHAFAARTVGEAARVLREIGSTSTDRGLGSIAAYFWSVFREASIGDALRTVDRGLKRIGVGRAERAVVSAAISGAGSWLARSWDDSRMGELRLTTRSPGVERDDLWTLSFAAAVGVLRASGGSVGGLQEGDVRDRWTAMRAYVLDEPPLDPLLDGEELMRMFSDLSPRTGFIREIQARLVRLQVSRVVRNPHDARAAVESMRAEVVRRFGA